MGEQEGREGEVWKEEEKVNMKRGTVEPYVADAVRPRKERANGNSKDIGMAE